MDMPKTVKQAVALIWITLAVSALIAVIDRRMGLISSEKFGAYLFLYALCCFFPYKIAKGSNVTRYVYSILMVLGYLFMLGGDVDGMTKLDIISSVVLIPVQAVIIWWLFTSTAKDWFGKTLPPPVPHP